MAQIDYGKPIRTFYQNCLRSGLELRVDSGTLIVEGNTAILSPVYKAEIVKRAPHLIELLTVGDYDQFQRP